MTEIILKTGWKHWDMYLSKFVGKKNIIMEIGAYKGEATKWFLKNLCNNNESLVIAIDTWQGSPEYTDVDFNIIENEFDRNILETGKHNQVIKIKKKIIKCIN